MITEAGKARRNSNQVIADYVQSALNKNPDLKVYLTGDFNELNHSRTIRELQSKTGLVDAFETDEKSDSRLGTALRRLIRAIESTTSLPSPRIPFWDKSLMIVVSINVGPRIICLSWCGSSKLERL